MTEHTYRIGVTWTGDRGSGTSGYRDYARDVRVTGTGVPALELSADKTFRGDQSRWNPELLLVAALAECHLLSFLHVAVNHGVRVVDYTDEPVGTMTQEGIGGHFTRVLLRPRVTITDPAQVDLVPQLHREAGQACFIAASVNFPVEHEPTTLVREA